MFKQPPALPYIVFLDESSYRGADDSNPLAERSVTLELYSDVINAMTEGLIEALLDAKAYAYTKNRTWIPGDDFFMTVYVFQTTERK